VAEATTDFVVPPTSVPRTEVRVIPRDAPEPQVRERTVEVAEAPASETAAALESAVKAAGVHQPPIGSTAARENG